MARNKLDSPGSVNRSPVSDDDADDTTARQSMPEHSLALVARSVGSLPQAIDDAAAAETLRKRLRHREYVKKSYHKKKATLDKLKTELDALELQYSALLLSHKNSPRDAAGEFNTTADRQTTRGFKSPLLRQYVDLAKVKARFQRENAELYELNAEFLWAQNRVEQLLDTDGQLPRQHRQLISPSITRSPAMPQFHFKSRPDAEYAKIIAVARDDILAFVYDTEKLSSGSRVFGWTDQRKVIGNELKFALEKEFPSISAHDLHARSWPIFSTPERFAKIYSASLHLKFHALQHINDDTHLFYRTVQVDGSGVVAKTVFLLARLRIEQGYMVMFRSIDAASVEFQDNGSSSRAQDETHAVASLGPRVKEVWVNKYSWVIFREQGPDACLFHFGGSTLSNLWLKEVLFIALRWETMAVGPPVMLEL